MARVPFSTRDDFPPDLQFVWDRLAADSTLDAGNGLPLNIFRVMGNNPKVLVGNSRFALPLWYKIGLDEVTRELVILRAAYVQNSAYEWHQHVAITRKLGVADDRIRAIRDWVNSDQFSESERALLALVDGMSIGNTVTKRVWDEVAKHFEPSSLVGVVLLIAYYFATAKFLAALEVETETPFIGWDLEG